ncbi:exodeoxyribonuclease V subunit gamma [Rahnella sikkimica]|uniref:RecBCD enzyme subunit RecC n=1 Tax=Rahnella sikkimica TaxID=1805933 RepID=A0A2L1UWN6_9GAMM|nr:exodeoxyribonuclease V subunit gamma [Rahnella sikkimica]AVF37311.1 exodeoxyribonuclease V subunit gamma [Rahnella sikkimica]
MVLHGNHSEALRDILVSWMAAHPLSPLENEVILVQSNGINQWLKLALARDVSEGGCGIAAALDIKLPARFFWQVYRAVLGKDQVPDSSPFDRSLLTWRLIRLLPQLLPEPVFAPLARFLKDDGDMRKLHQLAQRLADLFDQYQVYRADWLEDWGNGLDVLRTSRKGSEPVPENLLWQPQLWRALLDDVPESERGTSRAALHQRFLQHAQTIPEDQRPAGLPARLIVFGISSLPQQSLEVLAVLGRWTHIFMCVHNPCEHDWSDIIADKDLLRAERARQQRKPGMPQVIAEGDLHQHAHPLLAAWGKQGRDYIGLLNEYDNHESYASTLAPVIPRIDLFTSNGEDTLLHQLQEDILQLRPLAETKDKWPEIDALKDPSLRFSITHSAQREVEVLHDRLLAALAADPTLKARDIIVMVPDINGYAPHIQAVFGLMERSDPRYIPFTVADQGPRQNNPLLGALESLLTLPQSRFAVSDLLDLLDVPSVRQRFGIGEEQLPLLHRWISAANVRWGLHAEQRQSLGLPLSPEQNSWFFGLQRMLLGYAVGSGDAWQGIEPLDEIGGLEAALIGPLSHLLNCLDETWRQLCEPASPQVWGERLQALLSGYFAEDDGDDGFILVRLHTELETWLEACESVDLQAELPLSVVREHWLAQFDQSGLTQPFFGGAVTFATLMPMRAIPFRHVYLLGMNDGDYPRHRVPMDFDLMGRDYRPGDRSRREDDRYLFLEALLSARERLHISWVGRSILDNTGRPPSVLVAQLRDHLAAGWKAQNGGDLVHAISTEHRLQPFNRDYFSKGSELFSYAHEWRAGMDADITAEAPQPLPPVEQEGALTLRQLADFLSDPVRSFFRQRLNIYFELEDAGSEDQEPFDINALENWRLQDELIRAQKWALEAGESRQDILRQQLERIERRGELAPGEFAAVLSEDLAEPMETLFASYQSVLDEWPQTLANEALSVESAGVNVSDWLGDLRANASGDRARVVLESIGIMTKERSYRFDRLLPYWVAHLAGHLGGQPMHSIIISKNGTAELPPLEINEAQALWQQLIETWQQGQLRPLPLAVKTAFVWLKKDGTAQSPPDSDAGLAARDTYENHDPANMKFGERDSNPYLARAWPDFATLWSGGEFAELADKLLAPLKNHLSRSSKKGAKE